MEKTTTETTELQMEIPVESTPEKFDGSSTKNKIKVAGKKEKR